MPDHIVYHTASDHEIYECAYSLLKYLDIYNLKPPSNHSVVIYTDRPALLEAYGSFLGSFTLREAVKPEEFSRLGFIKNLGEKGNILYLDPNAYPVKELEPVFSAIGQGLIFAGKRKRAEGQAVKQNIYALGLNDQKIQSADNLLESGNLRAIDGYIAQYDDLKEFRSLLKNFFRRYQEESVPNQVKLLHHIDALQIQDQKKQFLQLPFYLRWMKKIAGKGWNISNYSVRI